MHRAGFKTVGVFKPVADDPAAGTKIFVIIPLKNFQILKKLKKNYRPTKNYKLREKYTLMQHMIIRLMKESNPFC